MDDIEKGIQTTKLSVLDALHNLTAAWHNVTPQTIQNCFKKAGFREGVAEETTLELEKVINGVNMEEFTTVDDNLETTDCQTVEEIMESLLEPAEDSGEDNDDDENGSLTTSTPNVGEALHAIKTLQAYLGATQTSSDWFSKLYSVENSVLLTHKQFSKQTTLDSYFTNR